MNKSLASILAVGIALAALAFTDAEAGRSRGKKHVANVEVTTTTLPDPLADCREWCLPAVPTRFPDGDGRSGCYWNECFLDDGVPNCRGYTGPCD